MQRISTARQCLLSTLYKSHLGINGVPQSWASSLKGSCRPQFCRSFAPYSLSCCWTFSGDSILPLFHHRDSVWVSKQLQGLSAHFLAASLLLMFCGSHTRNSEELDRSDYSTNAQTRAQNNSLSDLIPVHSIPPAKTYKTWHFTEKCTVLSMSLFNRIFPKRDKFPACSRALTGKGDQHITWPQKNPSLHAHPSSSLTGKDRAFSAFLVNNL